MNKRALLLMSLCILTSGYVELIAMKDNGAKAPDALSLKRSKSNGAGGIEVMNVGRSEKEEKEDGAKELPEVRKGRAARGQVVARSQQDQKAVLGVTWWVGSRLGRIQYAFAHPEDPRSGVYLNDQNGRHELGRELSAACGDLKAAGLTPETPSLRTIEAIVAHGKMAREADGKPVVVDGKPAYDIIIHHKELADTYTKLRAVEEQSLSDINALVADKRKQFIKEISELFYKEAKLIQHMAEIEKQAVRLCRDLNCPIESAPAEVKIPSIAEIFAMLCIGEGKHVQDKLGLEFTLEQGQ